MFADKAQVGAVQRVVELSVDEARFAFAGGAVGVLAMLALTRLRYPQIPAVIDR